MKVRKTFVTGALLSVLTFSSLSSAFAAADSTDESLNATNANIFIDASIQGHDRDVILNVMRTLDPADRENVTYRDANGKLYANKPELLEGMYELRSVGNNLYETPDGLERFAIPAPLGINSDSVNNPEGQFTLETGGAASLKKNTAT